jgi:hypothetical protein
MKNEFIAVKKLVKSAPRLLQTLHSPLAYLWIPCNILTIRNYGVT